MDAVNAYVAIRRAAGAKLKDGERNLKSFARFIDKRADAHVTAQAAVQWASAASTPSARAYRLHLVCGLARHLHLEDGRHEVPPNDLFGPNRSKRRVPFLFTRGDIERLIAAARALRAAGAFPCARLATLLALLAVTGLRVSEALNLRLPDITADGLLIRNTKFNKSRLVPIHETTRQALDRYLALRQRIAGIHAHVFVSLVGRPLDYGLVIRNFHRLCSRLGLDNRPGQPKPRIHDLRHAFATRSLETAARSSLPVTQHMLALSTYLGHAKVGSTYWYLEASPLLMASISNRMERFLERTGR